MLRKRNILILRHRQLGSGLRKGGIAALTAKHTSIVILHFFLRFVVPFIAPIALLFAKKSDRVTSHYGQDPTIQRYRLPKLFKWLMTCDEDLAGGMYEPTVKKIYDRFGWYICSWYWIGLRNQCQGLLWTQGFEVDAIDYTIKKIYDYRGDQWGDATKINLYWFTLVFEYEICHDHYRSHTKTGYYCIPKMSLKRN
jgi:hypothetical protein